MGDAQLGQHRCGRYPRRIDDPRLTVDLVDLRDWNDSVNNNVGLSVSGILLYC